MAFFFDKDNTCIETKDGSKYPSFQNQQIVLEVVLSMESLKEYGHPIAIGTNQNGVSFGFKSLDDVWNECQEALDLIQIVDLIVFCPDYGQTLWGLKRDGSRIALHELYPDLVGTFRKGVPGETDKHGRDQGQGGGMLLALCRFLDVEPGESVFVGDMASDKAAAIAAGLDYVDVKEL